jgi:drug/metabolite transporter (DMT)-like permease
MTAAPADTTAVPSRRSERLALAAFLTESVLAGGSAVSIRFSNRELAPLWGASLRFTLAAAVLLAVMAAMRLRPPRGRALVGSALFGALLGASFAFAYYALLEIRAGLGQTILALVPLATLLLAVAQRQERLRAAAAAGTLLALAGVALISRAPLREAVPPLSLLAALGGVLCFAQAAIVVRRFPPVHPVVMNGVGMAVGAVLLIAASVLAGEPHPLPRRAETWAALGYLVVVGSVVVFVLYLYVLRTWTATRAAYGFVLIPFVTVALSAWLDAEPVTGGLVAGGVLVLAGVYVGALRAGAAPAGQLRTPRPEGP